MREIETYNHITKNTSLIYFKNHLFCRPSVTSYLQAFADGSVIQSTTEPGLKQTCADCCKKVEVVRRHGEDQSDNLSEKKPDLRKTENTTQQEVF